MGTKDILSDINFIFTPEGFMPDTASVKEPAVLETWIDRGGYPALYEAGIGKAPGQVFPAALFLYRVSAKFFRCLTDLPGLELARDQAKVELSEIDVSELLSGAPFAIGSEYLTEEWLRKVFRKEFSFIW